MACESVINYLNALTGMFDREVWRQFWPVSPWLSLIRRGTWPDHIGSTINTVVYGRNAPAVAAPTWEAVTLQNGLEGGLCLPTAEKVVPGYRTRSYQLSRRRLIGPHFCAENLRFTWEMEKQMAAIVDALGGRAQIEWEYRDRYEYHKNCKYKVSCQDPLVQTTNWTDTIAATYPATAPTSRMTWGFLDFFRMKILRNGALLSALGMENGTPVLTVIASPETNNQLRLDIQGDLRFGAPAKLLAPFGVLGSLKGYYLLDDLTPRRFEFADAAFTQVATYILDTTVTVGEDYKINPSWDSASYEETFIFDPEVYRQNIPNPMTNAGAGVTFNPVNYTGTWRLLNIIDAICNPYGNNVFHDALLEDADEPMYPQRGVAYIHKRCDPALGGASCNTPQS